MANNWQLGMLAGLDSQSRNQLNQDIKAIQKTLNSVELKATLNPNQVKSLENQLSKLQVSLTDVTIPKSVLDGLVSQINNALSGIQIPNININPSGVGNAGKQIGEIISKEAANAIGDVTSKVIGQGFTVSPKMSQKVQSELENIVKDWTNGKGKISSITIDTKTDFNEQTLENIEHLKSATVQYSNELGQVITKTLKYKQIGVNTFANGETEAIKGWVESASTYKATLESTSKSTNNFVNQQKKAVTDLTNQVNQIYKSAIDPNASKPIKNSDNLSNLENQYNDIITAIGKMGSASEATFTDERNSVNTLISDLKIVVREYKNAETAATSMRSKDVGTVKAIKTNELDEFIAKIQNSKVPMKEMKSEIASLKTSLSNITDTDSLTAYLNQFDIASSKFKSLKEQFSKDSTVSSVIFNTSELEAQGKVYIQKVRNTIEAIKPELESKLRSAGYTDIEIKGVEKANGQIKSLTATVTDATGAFKQLNFQREKIQGKGKAQFGFVQTDDVKVIGTLSSSVEKVQGNLSTLKTKWEEQGVLVGDFKTKVEQLETSLTSVGSKGELNGLKSQIETLKSEASQIAEVNKIQHSLDVGDYDAQIETIKKGFISLSGDANEAETHVKGLRDALQSMHDATDDNGRLNAEKSYRLELEKTDNQLTIAKAKAKEYVDVLKVQKLKNDIQDWLKKNTAATKEAKDAMTAYLNTLDDVGHVSQSTFNVAKQGLDDWDTKMRQAGKLGKSLTETFKEGVKSFTSWAISSGAVMEVWNATKQGVQFIGKLDDALTDVTYTSNVSAKQLEDLGNSAIDMAKDLNTSAENILEAVKIYSTANATAEDILRKAQPAIMLSNISGMSGSESSKTINTSLNQFELEDTEETLLDITDTLQYVSSQLNYDFTEGIKEITEGIEASGNVAKNAGLSMQEYATMVGVAIEKTGQSGSTIGNAYKTIFSRITKASSTEGTIEEDISAAEKSLRSIGVEVRDSANEFRDLTDIMADLGKVWDSLSSVEKSNVGFQVAGTRQLNVLNSLFGAWDSYSSIMADIDKRTGETLKNQEVYAESLQGHLGDLSAVSQSVWNNLIESETLKSGIDLLTELLNILDKTTSTLGELGTIGLGAGLFAGIKNVGVA